MKNKVLVAGCGISGIGAARMLLAAGKSVILYDGNDKKNKEEIRAQVADNSSDETLSIVLGTLSQDVIDQSEYCVISPGIPTDLAFVEELKKNGVPIWSEIELAYHYAKGQVIGITGTNGKTTTTALTGEIMAAHFGKDKTFVVGNIGRLNEIHQRMAIDLLVENGELIANRSDIRHHNTLRIVMGHSCQSGFGI